MDLTPHTPSAIIHEVILPNHFFPNNPIYPFMVYKQTLPFTNQSPKNIQRFLDQNEWIRSWVDGISNYHHYHIQIN